MDVDTTVSAIVSMEIRGAGKIARAGASALSYFVENYSGTDLAPFMKELNDAKDKILGSRPTAV